MRERLERHQSWLYLIAISLGLGTGMASPTTGERLEPLLWPVLGCLLYVTFTQVRLTRLSAGFSDWRFVTALLAGNFLVIPVFLSVVLLLPLETAVQVGVLLVLLVPCTDWFISFTHLGRGDAVRAIAAAPLLLLVQLLVLPAYLWLFLGSDLVALAVGRHILAAFGGLILLPLLLAWGTERVAAHRQPLARMVARLGWLPVPLLALVVFLVAASQVTTVAGMMAVLAQVLLLFVAFLLFAAALGKLLGRLFRLDPPGARTLVFSFGTRNSFVVLPIALALPEAWQAAVVVIVFQSLVELFGMVAYLAWVPRRLIPDHAPARSAE